VSVASAVLDASAFVRALVERTDVARRWIGLIDSGETHGFVPDLFYAEVANALNNYVRAGYLRTEPAVEVLSRAVDLPLTSRSLRELAPAALALSLERGLTVYDAAYVALAEAADAVLITADRSFAEVVARSELLD
jgi:predicted nucleic acid-binding protein